MFAEAVSVWVEGHSCTESCRPGLTRCRGGPSESGDSVAEGVDTSGEVVV
jgi:hypothetical protein